MILPGWTTGCSEASALAVLYPDGREPQAHQAPGQWPVFSRRMLLKRPRKGGLTNPAQTPFVTRPPATRRFVNRETELEAVEGLLAAARGGSSAVLVLRGGPGVGKTMLLEHAIGRASGLRVGRVGGVDSEFDLPYAALHQLLAPFLEEIEALPGPQRDSLASTLGLIEVERSDRFLTALGVLTLLSNAAQDTGLLCAVDDAEWLDEALLRSFPSSLAGWFLRG
jgi:hypothetical protein